MILRASAVLVLLALLLGMLVWYETRHPMIRHEPIDAAATPAPEPVTAAAPDLDDFAPPPLASLTDTVERPLFSPTRRVVEAPAAVAVMPDTPVVAPVIPPQVNLTAVVIDGNEKVAVVLLPGSGKSERLREGDSVEGWVVDLIGPESVRLVNGTAFQQVDLRSFEPAPAAATGQPLRPVEQASRAAAPGTAGQPDRPRRPLRGPRLRSQQRQ